jgi:hypothetical protein
VLALRGATRDDRQQQNESKTTSDHSPPLLFITRSAMDRKRTLTCRL